MTHPTAVSLGGDCVEVMRELADQGVRVDSIVTDPPYHFGSIVKRFAKSGGADRPESSVGAYARHARGFMGKVWDGGDVAFRPETWEPALDILKPGGHLLAFGGTRTYHRLVCAVEDAGFEVRDTVLWIYGQGFPKSKNVGDGWGTALKPACEMILLGRKPIEGTNIANRAAHGTGALNIEACRVEGEQWAPSGASAGGRSLHAYGDGLNNAGKSGSNAAGRWPANLLHDGSEEVLEEFAKFGDRGGGKGGVINYSQPNIRGDNFNRAQGRQQREGMSYGDSGSVARFYYCAKASKKDRDGSKHPTVKPIALIRYLMRLVTPLGGTVLDPFAGSGTAAEAALAEGFNAILIERETEYLEDIERRLARIQPAA